MEGLPGHPGARPRRPTRRGGGVLTARRLILWRHGRTEWNADGRFQGQLDPPLDDVGRAQAAAAATVLARLAPGRIISSDLERASHTAGVLASLCGMPAVSEPRLRELHLGRWQGLYRDDVMSRFPEEYAAWQAGDDVRREGGETYAEVGARGAAAVAEALDAVDPDGLVVAVTHGGTARATIGVLLELDPASWWRLGPLGNCRWSSLRETPHGWRLLEHDSGVPEEAVIVEEKAGDDAR